MVLALCNKITRDMKVVKVYIDHTLKNVSASFEFFYTDKENLKSNIEHSLNTLGLIRSLYVRERSEYLLEK